jgi:hypothetical protein
MERIRVVMGSIESAEQTWDKMEKKGRRGDDLLP